MKFQRVERYERFAWTKRKQTMALSRPERHAEKLRRKLPLLADQIEAEAEVIDLDAEERIRQERQDNSEKRMRAFYARVWREARADYFAATNAQREAMRAHWAAWTGPATCLMFRYVVDEHNGTTEARMRRMRERDAAIRADVLRGLIAQGQLDLGGGQ